jgi:hypothetical protein
MSRTLATSAFCAAVLLATGVSLPAQSGDKSKEDKEKKQPRRPSLSLKAAPGTGMVPIRVSATAEFKGGDDDFQEYYCPTVIWDWGDDTTSESTVDCEPYEAGKSEIRRRFTIEHVFRRSGTYRVYFRLKQRDKPVGAATVNVHVQPGAREFH